MNEVSLRRNRQIWMGVEHEPEQRSSRAPCPDDEGRWGQGFLGAPFGSRRNTPTEAESRSRRGRNLLTFFLWVYPRPRPKPISLGIEATQRPKRRLLWFLVGAVGDRWPHRTTYDGYVGKIDYLLRSRKEFGCFSSYGRTHMCRVSGLDGSSSSSEVKRRSSFCEGSLIFSGVKLARMLAHPFSTSVS